MILLELIRAVLNLPEGSWVFGLALLGAAVANWVIGRRFNEKSLAKVRSHRIREKLLYRARHKFMSLPMETFSVIIAGAGVAILIAAISGIA
jgi:hypothetical protein